MEGRRAELLERPVMLLRPVALVSGPARSPRTDGRNGPSSRRAGPWPRSTRRRSRRFSGRPGDRFLGDVESPRISARPSTRTASGRNQRAPRPGAWPRAKPRRYFFGRSRWRARARCRRPAAAAEDAAGELRPLRGVRSLESFVRRSQSGRSPGDPLRREESRRRRRPGRTARPGRPRPPRR